MDTSGTLTPSSEKAISLQDNPPPSNECAVPLNAVSLPPVDGGFDAWAYLASAWVVELLVWSYPFSYGVFLNWYSVNLFKDSSKALLPLVGSLSTGIIYLSSVVILPAIFRYPRQKKNLMIFGLVLCFSGLVGAAFSTQPWQLVITQGIMYSTGGSFLYFPVMSFLFEWFSEKKGLANGLIFSGTGLGGVVVPFIIQALLHKYGHKTTLLSMAVALVVFILPAFPYIKSRLPPSDNVAPRSFNTQFTHHGIFWVLFIANLVQGLATFLPFLYLPTFARDLGLSDTSGTLVLSMMNGASAPGLIFIGWLSDNYDLRLSMILSTIGSSFAVFFLWGLSESLAPLVIFACIYGFLAPSWSSMWPSFISTVVGDDPFQSSTVMSIFFAGRGIGNALSAPISSGLLRPWVLTDRSKFAYGLKGYGPLITFTGLTLLVSVLGVVYRSFEDVKGRQQVARRARRVSEA